MEKTYMAVISKLINQLDEERKENRLLRDKIDRMQGYDVHRSPPLGLIKNEPGLNKQG